VALTNAEKQRRWREKRNELAAAFTGIPKEVAENILSQLGVDKARRVVRALDKRLRNLKPDCIVCGGTGFAPYDIFTACGLPTGKTTLPCDCSPETQALVQAKRPQAG
jgi:hypothetical protein